MIVGGKERSDEGLNWWEFTQFELDPSFPPGLFEVPAFESRFNEPIDFGLVP